MKNELLPNLEGQGLRVCIDFRDFAVGVSALDNMRKAIGESRATILILTPSYVKNEWNAFRETLPSGKNRLLPVFLEKSEIPAALKDYNILNLSQPEKFEIQLNNLTAVSRDRG